MSIITGTCFVRDLKATNKDKKLFLFMGQLWVPASIELKSEHLYRLIGSEFHTSEPELLTSIGLQVLLNSERDLSSETRKKHPSQIVPFIHMPTP